MERREGEDREKKKRVAYAKFESGGTELVLGGLPGGEVLGHKGNSVEATGAVVLQRQRYALHRERLVSVFL